MTAFVHERAAETLPFYSIVLRHADPVDINQAPGLFNP